MKWLAIALALFLAACGTYGPERAQPDEVAALAMRLQTLSPDVDPKEARRAAEVTYETTYALAVAYQITDPPLIHNTKVNAGTKPRGLCYHWAEDLEARLNEEDFETLAITRAIANADNPLLIDHSTAVITAAGAPMEAGVVVDPWRYGGRLFWENVSADKRYDWHPREDVLRAKGRIRYVHRTEGSLASPPQP